MKLPYQDAGTKITLPLREGYILIYHTHGLRQYLGTCKLHLNPDCRHLLNWKPMMVMGRPMGKVLMREAVSFASIDEKQKCKTCFK